MVREATSYLSAEMRARLAWTILLPALMLGVLADALIRATPPGLGVPLWTAVLVITIAAIWWRRRETFRGVVWWLPAVALLGAGGIAWRDSPALKALDLLIVMLALALTSIRAPAIQLHVARLNHLALAPIVAGLNAFLQPVALTADLTDGTGVRHGRWFRHAQPVAFGVLLGLPLLLLFGSLFVAADAVFARYVADVVPLDVRESVVHVAIIAGAAWFVAGFLRGAALDAQVIPVETSVPRPLRLGMIEAGIALALLDLLFIAFVAVQVRYLFGGADLVLHSDLTYAEYARRGFFELVTVSVLVLPLLLLTDWLLRRTHPAEEWVFRVLAGVLLALLVVVMASALQRMRLYQREYGLTELRLYTTAFMLWLAAVFAWLAATVLRGRPERFAFGALVAGLLAIAALHLLNPDALIARTNVARMADGRPADVQYLGRLSADAVPTLVDSLPKLPESERCDLARTLRLRWSGAADDWRSWSLSRARAEDAVRTVPMC